MMIAICISVVKACKSTGSIDCTLHWFTPIRGFGDSFPTPGWLHRVTDWIPASTGVAGDLRDEWALPGGNSSPGQLPPAALPQSALSCRLIWASSAIQSNPGCGPPCASIPPSLPVSIAGLLRCHCEERLTRLSWTWVGPTDRVLTPHCRHGCLSFLPPTTSHPLTSIAPKAKKERRQWATLLIYSGNASIMMNTEAAAIEEQFKFPQKVRKTNEFWLLVGPEGHAVVVEGLSD